MKQKLLFYVLSVFTLLPDFADGQQNFNVHLIPSSITSAPAVHSGAFAIRNGKWIFIGGRRDGLHIMQASQAFPANLRNDSVYVVDPVNDSYKAASVTQLPMLMFGALSSANMQFYQDEKFLYMIGGYGAEDSSNFWITFPTLISIDLDCLINKVDSGVSITGCFRMLTDSNMAVTGGALEKIDSTFYLVFGHRFDGRYSSTPSVIFSQRYTQEIRKFNINDNGISLSISNYTTVQDTDVFHRRDFNIAPQIFPNHDKGFTVFGGVFQKQANLPFLTPVDVFSQNIIHQSNFNENLNQYTTALLPVYDSVNNYMHTVFFGGLSLYTLDTITMSLIQDTLIPFVSTISKVTRDPSGNLSESKLPENMPSLKGTNAMFIPDFNVPMYPERIIKLNNLTGVTRVGFLAGGIHSDLPNVADIDPVSLSRPNAQLYEVYIDKTTLSISDLQLTNAINNLLVFPNPVKSDFVINFSLKDEKKCSITLFDLKGNFVRSLLYEKKLKGHQEYSFSMNGLSDGIYHCSVNAGTSVKIVKIVLNRNRVR